MQNELNKLWNSWTKRSFFWVLLAFIIIATIRFPFVFLFDTILTKIGNFYVYIWAFPEALFLYYTAFKLKIKWTSTTILGIEGIVGIPIDYYFEWIVDRNLVSPWCAVDWGIFFIIMGISADISLILLYHKNTNGLSAIFSSLIFTMTVILLTYLGNTLFYSINLYYFMYPFAPNWNTVAPIFVPYALVTGMLGGYLGYFLNKSNTKK